MRGLGWNPELLGGAWSLLQRLEFGSAVVAGETALAGYWLHHRLVERLELLVPDQSGLESLRLQLPEATSRLELPGFLRLRAHGVDLEIGLESSPALEAGPPDPVPPMSLRDLAADRWLRIFTPSSAQLALVDLYFLSRRGVDLKRAAREMSHKDLGASQRALAVALHEQKLGPVPTNVIRPVTEEALQAFRQEWVEVLGIEAFS